MSVTTDPVCGMKVADDTPHHLEHQGQHYRFCSRHCLDKFQASPSDYVDARPASSPSSTGGVSYTCPMHPEIRQPALGSCPKCGMALEQVNPVSARPDVSEYTCPMHPQIVRSEPGSCPICGMALEPRNAPLEDNTELKDMTRRFWLSAALALPVFIMAMVSDLAPQFIPDSVSMTVLQWLEFALATPAVLWGGWPVFQRGWASLVNRQR